MSVPMSEEAFEAICQRIEAGESLKSMLFVGDKDMPAWSSFHAWMREKPERLDRYARARETQATWFADEIIDVARNSTNQTWSADRLLVDALKWSAGKQAPRMYGDKTTVKHEGDVNLDVRIVESRKRSGVGSDDKD